MRNLLIARNNRNCKPIQSQRNRKINADVKNVCLIVIGSTLIGMFLGCSSLNEDNEAQEVVSLKINNDFNDEALLINEVVQMNSILDTTPDTSKVSITDNGDIIWTNLIPSEKIFDTYTVKVETMDKKEFEIAKQLSNYREEVINVKKYLNKNDEEENLITSVNTEDQVDEECEESLGKQNPELSGEKPSPTPTPTTTPTAVVIEEPIGTTATAGEIYNKNFTANTPVVSSSGLTIEQIDQMLYGTPLYGYGYAIYNVEKTYGINAFFTLGVAGTESSFGKSKRARRVNDCFGQLKCSFSSFEEGILYFGNNLDKNYKTSVVMTPYGIDPKYSGHPENTNWGDHVIQIMNQYANKL